MIRFMLPHNKVFQNHHYLLLNLLVILCVGLLLTACNLPGTNPGRPQIAIQAPPDESVYALDEPIIISAVATDPTGSGVVSVEVFVNNESVRVLESPAGQHDIFDIATSLDVDQEGTLIVTLIAYRRDGTPSNPATLTVDIVAMTRDPEAALPTGTSPSGSANPPSAAVDLATSTSTQSSLQGRVTSLANIRSGPGEFCTIVGYAEEGDVINLLEFSRNELWYKTDFQGQVGWIFTGSVDPLTNDDDLLVGDRLGCQGCGDGTCNANEACDTCAEDCGQCCGNGVCQAEIGEDCGTCELDCGGCCGDGVCEASRGEDCGTCSSDCGACCGNGLCEADRNETCATCGEDCGSCCGNGLCEAGQGETCSTCAADCGTCCGNGLCEASRGETCDTCSDDCGVCTPEATCGDSTCDPEEDCSTCEADCGACAPAEPVCGDATCEGTETCESCEADCGVCP